MTLKILITSINHSKKKVGKRPNISGGYDDKTQSFLTQCFPYFKKHDPECHFITMGQWIGWPKMRRWGSLH